MHDECLMVINQNLPNYFPKPLAFLQILSYLCKRIPKEFE